MQWTRETSIYGSAGLDLVGYLIENLFRNQIKKRNEWKSPFFLSKINFNSNKTVNLSRAQTHTSSATHNGMQFPQFWFIFYFDFRFFVPKKNPNPLFFAFLLIFQREIKFQIKTYKFVWLWPVWVDLLLIKARQDALLIIGWWFLNQTLINFWLKIVAIRRGRRN